MCVRPLFAFFIFLGAASLGAAEAITAERVELLFRPRRGEQMALSPDGRYLAYTDHNGTDLVIIVQDLTTFAVKTRILADEDRPVAFSKEQRRVMLRFLRWAEGGRLIFAPEIEVINFTSPTISPETRRDLGAMGMAMMTRLPRFITPVMAVDADGRNARQLADAKDFQTAEAASGAMQQRPLTIKGFPAGDRGHLILAMDSTADGEPSQVLKVDVQTGKSEIVQSELMRGRTYFDWQGRMRLNEVTDRAGAVTFHYRAPDAARWDKLAPPAGAGFNLRFSRTPETSFDASTVPLAFDFNPDVLIVASNVGRDTYGVYGFNLKTWQRTNLAIEHPGFDLPAGLGGAVPAPGMVFDESRQALVGVRAPGGRRYTVWLDAELGAVQRKLEQKFPGRTVYIAEWSDNRTRFLVAVSGANDPGRIYLYQRAEDLAVELSRRAPWLPNAALHTTQYFECAGPGGTQLSGYLTLPSTPRLNPPPVIICFAPGLPPRPQPEYDPQSQIFADMGFIVCRLNQRGISGFGAKYRDALRQDFAGAPAADALAALAWIAGQHRIDRKRVALYGEAIGAYHAVRAAEEHPDVFRCAIGFEPVLDIKAWVQPPADFGATPTFAQRANRAFLGGSDAALDRLSLSGLDDRLSVPVFFAVRGVSNSPAQQEQAAAVSHLQFQLNRRDLSCTVATFGEDFLAFTPAARVRVYRQLEEFFNLNLYNYDVKIGPTRVVK